MNVATNIFISAILIYHFDLAFWWWIALFIVFILEFTEYNANRANIKIIFDYLEEIKYLIK